MNAIKRLALLPSVSQSPSKLRHKTSFKLNQSQLKQKQPRFKTQPDEFQPIFVSNPIATRRYSFKDKHTTKQQQKIRDLFVFKSPTIHRSSKEHKPPPIKSTIIQKIAINIQSRQRTKASASYVFKDQKQGSKNISIDNYQKNLLFLAQICNILMRNLPQKQLIAGIKKYILQQQSDLDSIEELLAPQKQQKFRLIVFYERVLLIAIVENMINYRQISHIDYAQLIKQLIHYHSFIYLQLTQTSLHQLLIRNGKGFVCLKTSQESQISSYIPLTKKMKIFLKPLSYLDIFTENIIRELEKHSGNMLYYQLLEFYATFLVEKQVKSKAFWFLQTCPSPYIRHEPTHKYTLLLDLDQTLVHYKMTSKHKDKGEFLIRPYLYQFLQRMVKHFQLGIFTCAIKQYADTILDRFPSISFRLYRQHAIRIDEELVKDLSRVGRSLSKVILVDNLKQNFRLQPKNGIHVQTWTGNQNDKILNQLAEELQLMIAIAPQDVRRSSHRRSFL